MTLRLKRIFSQLWKLWDQFWFSSVDLYNLGLFRSLIFALLFVMYSIRLMEVRLLFFESGLMPAGQAGKFLPEFYRPLFTWYPATDLWILILHIALIALLFLGIFGLLGRALTWLVLVLHLVFLQRNFTVAYGADVIATFWLFYLSLTQNSKCFRLFRSEPCPVALKGGDLFTSVGYRLLQIQLCIIYTYTGMEKLKGPSWWEGTAVWRVLGNTQLAPMDFSFMAQVPGLVALMTYSTLLFELYFAVVVWIRPVRKYWLMLGFVFHFMAAFTMGLYFFSLIMVAAYILFIPSDSLRSWESRMKWSRLKTA